MKFFLDENFPKAAVGLLEGMGHEVFDLRGSGREGLPDPDIFAEAQCCDAVFLTTDRDFFHTIPHIHEARGHHCDRVATAKPFFDPRKAILGPQTSPVARISGQGHSAPRPILDCNTLARPRRLTLIQAH